MEASSIPREKWGQLGYLTSAQNDLLKQFISEVPSEEINIAKYTVESIEQVSLRFLRARQFDFVKAKALIHECYCKKVENKARYYASLNPDDAAACDISVLRKFYPHTQRGFDKENRLLLFEKNGKTDVNPIFLITTKQTLLAYHFWTMENALDRMFIESSTRFYHHSDCNNSDLDQKPPPEPVNISTTAILDFDGLGLSHCSSKMLELVKLFISIDNVCYPEMLGKMLVINAPFLAVQTYKLVKGLLDPRTQAKIEIISPHDSIRRMHELIDKKYLPSDYGGTAPDLYYFKPNTEYVTIPKQSNSVASHGFGEIIRTIAVPYGKTLFVDTYLSEGAIEVIVSSCVVKTSVITEENTKKSFFSRAVTTTNVTTVTSEVDEIMHETVELKVPVHADTSAPVSAHRGSERLLKKYPCISHSDHKSSDEVVEAVGERLYRIIWRNTVKTTTRQIVYSLTVSDTPEFPDMFSEYSKKTSLDNLSVLDAASTKTVVSDNGSYRNRMEEEDEVISPVEA